MARGFGMRRHYKALSFRESSILTIAFAAIEVFPKECMGGLLAVPGRIPLVSAAVPYQLAKRTTEGVDTYSSPKLSSMRLGRLVKIGDFHSHPFAGAKDSEPLKPSECDFKDSTEGEVDLIVRVVSVRLRMHRSLRKHGKSLSMSEGRFRILVKAYYRGVKNYEEIDIRLCKE